VTAVGWGLLIGGVIGLLIGIHGGAGATHHRYQRAMGRKPRLFASLGRGAFVWGSLPLPGGFRVGRRL
jgi:hypothetical protein